jgi:hypothetical protein
MKSDDFFNIVGSAIASGFRKTAHAGKLVHEETHRDKSVSYFSVNASAQHVAFSLDVRGLEPLAILNPSMRGLTARNDLTIVCLSEEGVPLVFIIECKNAESPGKAQEQIECGQAFCEYLFKLLQIQDSRIPKPRYFGVAVYRPKSPPKGITGPAGMKFKPTGKAGLPRADWHIDTCLPLNDLIRATEAKR